MHINTNIAHAISVHKIFPVRAHMHVFQQLTAAHHQILERAIPHLRSTRAINKILEGEERAHHYECGEATLGSSRGNPEPQP